MPGPDESARARSEAAFMDKLVALCKRRGFIFQSSEIYGGIGGFWDYGPLGVELKRNIKEAWWHDYVTCPPDGPDGREISMVGLDCSIIMNPKVWKASGHATGFADPMVDCKACKARFRADKIFFVYLYPEEQLEKWAQDAKDWAEVGIKSKATWTPRLCTAIEADSLEEAFVSAPNAIAQASRKAGLNDLKRGRLEGYRFEKSDAHTGWDYVKLRYESDLSQPYGGWFFPVLGFKGEPRPCPRCGERNSLTEPRQFNLMFESHAGAVSDEENKVYLRPETAQGIFVNYKNVLDTSRVKVPFGIAQIGKAFRNEINPRNFTFRSREFEQMEIEFFCRGAPEGSVGVPPASGSVGVPPALTDLDWYHFWRNERYQWYIRHGLKSEKLRLRDQGEKELAHYSRACADIEYRFPFSDEFQELEGVAHRGCFDLTQHQQHSGRDLSYFDDDGWQAFMQQRKERGEPELSKEEKARASERFRFLPTVIEPSAGVDRAALAFLCEAYCEDQAPDEKGVMQTRVVMKLHPRLAPIKAAFFPLVNKEGMPDIAHRLYREARRHFNVYYDDGGAIGRRYRRQDEAGTPWCITVDGQTLQDGTVTIRDRDTLQQVRVSAEQVVAWLKERLGQP